MCYTHQVLQEICVEVAGEYDEHTEEYTWKFVSGCFKNGEFEKMQSAKAETSYHFENVPIKLVGVGKGFKG